MTSDLLLTIASASAILVAVSRGPLILAVRACLRRLLPAASVRQWQVPVATGVAIGMFVAVFGSGAFLGGAAAVITGTLCLLVLMAVLDLAWRWLPFEWTLPLLALGGVSAIAQHRIEEAIWGALFGGGILLTLQFAFWVWRGITALGTGDIWLAAGLGSLLGMPQISWVLCLAALSALAFEGAARLAVQGASRQRFGVAYGTHLCLAYLVFVIF